MLGVAADPDLEPAEGATNATAELAVEGMHCSACATRVERALVSQPAVLSASVSLLTHRAFVTYAKEVAGPGDLCAAVEAAGYSAEPVAGIDAAPAQSDPEHWRVRAVVSWPLAIAALLVALVGPENAAMGWLVLSFALVVELAGGWP